MAENIRQFDDSENQLNDNKPSNLPCENNNVDCLNTDVILDSINVEENIEIQEEIVLTHAEEEVKFQPETIQGDKCEENHVVIVDTCSNEESKESIERNHNLDPVKEVPKGTVLTNLKTFVCNSFCLLYEIVFEIFFFMFISLDGTMAAKHNK